MSCGRVPLLMTLATCAVVLTAQQRTYVSGLIQDPSRGVVRDAEVTVVNQDTGFRRTTSSQQNGSYVVASLQPGFYKITVRKEGFRTLVRFGVKLDAAQPVRVDFTLPLGSMSEVITVTSSAPLLNTEDASVGTVVRRDRIERLPLNGRGLLSLLELAPGTVVTPATRGESGQFTASGQRPNMNYFSVDGISANTGVSGGGQAAQVTGGSLPGLTALGSLHSLVSLDALDEFRVETSTASPELGRLPGAQVQLSTRSGSNEWHGALLEYWRNEHLDANGWFANRAGQARAPLRMNNFGASLGGPLKRNRTFFFLSYEGMRLREPFAWRSASPSMEARAEANDWVKPLLDLFPIPAGPDLGANLAEWNGQFNRRSRFDVAGARLDHSIASWLTVFGRYNFAPSSNEFATTQINHLSLRSSSLTLGINALIRPSLIADVKMNRSDSRGQSRWSIGGGLACAPDLNLAVSSPVPDFCDSLFRLSVAGVGQAVYGQEPDQRQRHEQAIASVTWTARSHQLRFGFDHRRFLLDRRDYSRNLSVIAEGLADLLAGRDLWLAYSAPQSLSGRLAEYSGYIQDTWRLHRRVTATFGVRWEYALSPVLTIPSGADPPVSYVFPGQDTIWRDTRANWAPRMGIAFRPRRSDSTVVRGGFGVFYDSSLSIATDVINGGPFNVALYSNPRLAPFSTVLRYGFMPNLRLPAMRQWNVTIEHGTEKAGVFSAAYVGSSGERLLRREFNGLDNSETLWLALATNNGESTYHSLQLQYRKPLTTRFQGLVSYAWAHSIDNSSSDSVLHRVNQTLSAIDDRGSSDFDVRQSLTTALTYQIPKGAMKRYLGGWGIDGIFRARSGFPMTVLNSEYSSGLSFANAFRPDRVPGRSLWIGDPNAPGGRRLNPLAFQSTAGGVVQGNLGRNSIAGLGMYQIDTALRREFALGGQTVFQFRVEGFNLLNHPNFGDPLRYLSNPLFGESASMLNLMLGTGSPGSGLTPAFQTGGARSVQISLRLRF